MKRLYAPWRKKYVEKVHDMKQEKKPECPFCSQPQDMDDARYFILDRGKHNYVIMNAYPYNAGHLLVIPYEHQANLEELSDGARQELMTLTNKCVIKLKGVLGAHGINIGINLGKAAGAGIPEHLHQHVLPRWLGDTNFLPLIAETKQVSVDLPELYAKLKAAWSA